MNNVWLLESGDCNPGTWVAYPFNTWKFVINEFVFVGSFILLVLWKQNPHFTNLWLIFYPYHCLIPVNPSSSRNPFSFNFCKIILNRTISPHSTIPYMTKKVFSKIPIPQNIFLNTSNKYQLLTTLILQFIYAQFVNHFFKLKNWKTFIDK